MKKNARIEIKGLTEEGTFEGWLSTYGNVDQGGDMVEPGAYTKTIKERGGEIPLLWQHDPHEPIGKLQLTDEPQGLRVKGALLMELPTAQKAYLLIKNQIIKGMSIGYETIKKEMDGSIRKLKEIKLFEGSVVTFPMDTLALITAVKEGKATGRKEDFNEEWAEAQLCSAACNMRYALGDALSSFLYDPDLSRDERISGSETSVQQFADAYMSFLPQFLDMMSEEVQETGGMGYMSRREAIAKKAGARHSSADKTRIQNAIELLSALLGDEAGSTTSEPEAAPKSEPILEDHSAAVSLLLQGIRSLIPAVN